MRSQIEIGGYKYAAPTALENRPAKFPTCGVAAARQRAALFRFSENCGGLPTRRYEARAVFAALTPNRIALNFPA
jgi:hypothetical protein